MHDPEGVAGAEDALDSAAAAAEETGARSELPFIERTRRSLALVTRPIHSVPGDMVFESLGSRVEENGAQ